MHPPKRPANRPRQPRCRPARSRDSASALSYETAPEPATLLLLQSPTKQAKDFFDRALASARLPELPSDRCAERLWAPSAARASTSGSRTCLIVRQRLDRK